MNRGTDSNWETIWISVREFFTKTTGKIHSKAKNFNRRLGSFSVTKRITNTNYQIQDDKDPSVLKTVHRNHLVGYYPKEKSLPPMIQDYVPHDQQHDDLY